MASIKEIATTTGFQNTSSGKIARPQTERNLPVINNARTTTTAKISTSIDCYVAGEYFSGKGDRIEVVQRYSIFISYDSSTQQKTMEDVRARIVNDFEQKYGSTFNISTVDIPDLLTPNPPPTADAAEFYRGSEEWRLRIARASFDIGTESKKASKNITNIRRRYDL